MNLPNANDFEAPFGNPGDRASPIGEPMPQANRLGSVNVTVGRLRA